MREGVIVIKRLWTEERASFDGDFYTIKDAFCNPKPLQKPHPPIVLGGGGEKFTLKTVAELADGWNIWGAAPEDYERKVDVLTRYCDELGRSIENIELSWSGDIFLTDGKRQTHERVRDQQRHGGIVCTYGECVESLQKYIDLGCSHFIFSLRSFSEERELFAETIMSSF